MKAKLRKSNLEKTVIIDQATGELLDVEIKQHSYMTADKEEFYLIYSSLIGLLGQLSNPSVKVLSYILLNFKINTQFEIGATTRKLIAEKMKISTSAVANSLTELKDKQILYSNMKSIYQINPRYAFQGSTTNRQKALKAIIELGCKDC